MTALQQNRHLVTEFPGPRSRELMRRKAKAVSAGVGTTMPVFAKRAAGGIVEDVDGNRLIDLGSGIAVTTVGNSSPKIVDAVYAQVQDFTHTCFMVTPYEGYIEVAERLSALTPGEHAKRSALFNTGSEAVENAVKIARHYTGRDAIVVFDHAYHGRTNLTMAMTAKNMPYKHGFGPFAGEIYRAPMSYPFRDQFGFDGKLAAAHAIATIEAQVGAENVAAIVIEPIQGEGGFIVPAPGFLAGLAEWTQANGSLFVADEVQSGFGRTGAWFATEHDHLLPDLIVTAKAIAGGLPLAAVTGRAEILDSIHVGGLGGTYGGNPLACAAALATMDVIESELLLERAREIEEHILYRLRTMQTRDDRLGDIRGRGAMIAAEFIDPATNAPDAGLTKTIATYAHMNGVITLTCGTWGNVLRFLPPLTISNGLLEEAMDVIAEGLATA